MPGYEGSISRLRRYWCPDVYTHVPRMCIRSYPRKFFPRYAYPNPLTFITSYPRIFFFSLIQNTIRLNPGYSYPRTPDIHKPLIPGYVYSCARIFILSYPGHLYLLTTNIYTLVPPLNPKYLYPRSHFKPRIFIPFNHEYLYPRSNF